MRNAGPLAGQAVPPRVGPEVGLAVEPLVHILVDAVVRKVARQIETSVRRDELGGDVLPLVACGALHPVGRLLPDGGDPGARLAAAEQRSSVDPHGESLAFSLAERIVRQVVERAAQRLDRSRGDVGRPLRHLDVAEVHRVDEPVRLRAAPAVGRAVRETVDAGADLRLVDGDLEAAHGDVARPVVEPVRVPSWTETPGRLSTTDVTAVMFDCCIIIGSATTLRAKIRGSAATTLTVSSSRSICMTIGTASMAPAATTTRKSIVSKPGKTAVTW